MQLDKWLKQTPLAVAACLCALVFTSSIAEAQSRLCRQLEAQLATASSRGNSAQFRKYDRAVKTQGDQIRKARRNARRAGCKTSGISLFGVNGNSRQCRSLVSTINRMERNLAQLERRRARYDRGGSSAVRLQILARIEANGCRDRQQVARRDQPRERQENRLSILDQIFRQDPAPSRRRNPLDDEYGNRVRTILNDGAGAGGGLSGLQKNFRTLCVRTCDGYYFPVSFAVSEFDLDRDQKVCEAMCPGTEVRLYYHRVTDEESEDMISISGEPYTELGTAFLYRQPGYKREKSCGCSPPKDFSVIAGNPQPEEAVGEDNFIPFPTARPDPAADPETLANRDGGLTPDVVAKVLTPPPSAEKEHNSPTERKVRVVGPAFLPDQEGAIDLRARDRKSVQ
ncbi:MAG: DUF2865 domain-containing protein [Rhizobiaceae bacterium]